MVERVYGRLTAAQVLPLLPGKTTDQEQHSASSCDGTGDYVPIEISNDAAGVDDGDRTRDNWSHSPESYTSTSVFYEKIGGPGTAKGATDRCAPSTSNPALAAWLSLSPALPPAVRVALLDRSRGAA
jgi:hypothetical protein